MIKIVKILTLTVLTSFIIVPSVYSQTAEDYLESGNEKYKLNDYSGAIQDYTKAIVPMGWMTLEWLREQTLFTSCDNMRNYLADFEDRFKKAEERATKKEVSDESK